MRKPICVFAPIPVTKKYDILETSILKKNRNDLLALSYNENIQIIVKLHPSDDGEVFLKKIAGGIDESRIKVIKKYDALDLCVGIDFMVAGNTTFAIDALCFKKPVIFTEKISVDKYGFLNYFHNGTWSGGISKSVKNIIEKKDLPNEKIWKEAYKYLLNGSQFGVCKNMAEELTKNQEYGEK